MPVAGFSPRTDVDFVKCRHIHLSPHLSGHIHPQYHNSLVKIGNYDDENSFKHSELKEELSPTLYKSL